VQFGKGIVIIVKYLIIWDKFGCEYYESSKKHEEDGKNIVLFLQILLFLLNSDFERAYSQN